MTPERKQKLERFVTLLRLLADCGGFVYGTAGYDGVGFRDKHWDAAFELECELKAEYDALRVELFGPEND